MPPEATGIILRSPAQGCSKKMPRARSTWLVDSRAADVVEPLHGQRIALELSDRRAGVDVIDSGHPHPFCDHAKRHAVVLLPRVGRVARAMQVQHHVVFARPFRHRLDRRVADDEIDHDDHRAQFLGELGTLVYVLHRRRADIEVMALHLSAGRLRPVDRLHAVEKAVTPVHERL
jgi:hypothetical protein